MKKSTERIHTSHAGRWTGCDPPIRDPRRPRQTGVGPMVTEAGQDDTARLGAARRHLVQAGSGQLETAQPLESDIANFKAALAAVGGLGGRVHPQIAWAKLESLVRVLNSLPNSCGDEHTRVDNPALSTRPCDDAMSIPVQ